MLKRKPLARLRDTRRARNLTQGDVGLATGINPTRISHFETGMSQPSKDQQAALAKFFRVPVAQLFATEGR